MRARSWLPVLICILIAGIVSACLPPPRPVGAPPLAAALETATLSPLPTSTLTPTATPIIHPLMIEVMRQQEYPGSQIVFEETLGPGFGYDRYIVSYLSEGYKIYALLTIPRGERPASGWPVVIFNHGYIPPSQYRTTERYVAYVDGFARHGYIVLKSDYRGHGNSEGSAVGGYGSPAYTADVLNGLASIKQYTDADPNRIAMWGHSMGGQVTLRAMVVSNDIKAGVIWGGVVGSYPDLLKHWTRRAQVGGVTATPNPGSTRFGWRSGLANSYGTPEENPEFWAAISPNTYVSDLSGPLQLHHSTTDESVPVILSELLYSEALAAGMTAELYLYEGDDHDITANFSTAMQRSIEFFDDYVKGE